MMNGSQHPVRWMMMMMSLLVAMAVLSACGFGQGGNATETAGGSSGDGSSDVASDETPEPGALPRDFRANLLFPPALSSTRLNDQIELMGTVIYNASSITIVPTATLSESELILEQCNNTETAVSFMPASAYLVGRQLCGLTAAGTLGRDGRTQHYVMLLVRNNSLATSVRDLNDLTWTVADPGLSNEYAYTVQMFREVGATPGNVIPAVNQADAIRKLLNHEAEFAAVAFRPPRTVPPWQEGQSPEPFAAERQNVRYEIETGRSLWNQVELLDARVLQAHEYPDIFALTRIVALSPPVPNEVLVFGRQFDQAARNTLQLALVLFFQSAECQQSLCNDPTFAWTSLDAYSEAAMLPVQSRLDAAAIDAINVFGADVVENFTDARNAAAP